MTLQEVVYQIPGMRTVRVERDLGFSGASGTRLSFDLARPPQPNTAAHSPAVIFVSGFSDPGFESFVGCKFKEMAAYVTWAELAAASGIAAITYTNQDPVADLDALIAHLHGHSEELGLDPNRFAIWACSGNVPTAFSLLIRNPKLPFKAAVFCYGPLLEVPGVTMLAEAAKQFGFAYPCAGASIEDWPAELPLMLVRAGKETMPGLNRSIDHFVSLALDRNLALTLVNHATGPHAFDVLDNTEASRETVRRMLEFMGFHLRDPE